MQALLVSWHITTTKDDQSMGSALVITESHILLLKQKDNDALFLQLP